MDSAHPKSSHIGIIAADRVPLTREGSERAAVPRAVKLVKQGRFPAIHRDAKPKRSMTRHGQSPWPHRG